MRTYERMWRLPSRLGGVCGTDPSTALRRKGKKDEADDNDSRRRPPPINPVIPTGVAGSVLDRRWTRSEGSPLLPRKVRALAQVAHEVFEQAHG
ncbi:MAG TPA: hypothetical protein VFU72_14020, partial [Nitrolancea sp.]|nr:hypothetical protein [Nitrolancea sp.]